MTALTTMFNHLLGWLFALVMVLFGIPQDSFASDKFSPEVMEIANKFAEEFFTLNPDFKPLSPIILLPVGIFLAGAIIGLVRRLVRG